MPILARAVQGFGGAAIMPLSLTLLVGSVATKYRPLAIGIWGGIAGLGVALVPLALIALPNSFGAKLCADVFGLFLVGLGVLGVVYGIMHGNDAGWSSLEVMGSLIAGGALSIAFVYWESRTPAPPLPLRLFRDRSFSVANIIGLTFSFGVFGSIFILIQFLQVVQGYSPLQAVFMTMPWTMAPMVIAPLAGLIAPRVCTRLLIILGLTFQATGLFWFASTMTATVAYLALLPAFIFAAIGMGLVLAPISTAVLATIKPDEHAKASGTNSTLREIGVALGIAVLTAVFVGAGVLALSAVIAFALPAGRASRTEEHAAPSI